MTHSRNYSLLLPVLQHQSKGTVHGTKATVDHVYNSEVTSTQVSQHGHNDLCKCSDVSKGHNDGWILVCKKRTGQSPNKRHSTTRQGRHS